MRLRKIVVIGPESTGKSTLCEGLAAHFGTRWVPEYAREYLLAHGKEYRFEDLKTIARGQIELEERFAREVAGAHGAAMGAHGAEGDANAAVRAARGGAARRPGEGESGGTERRMSEDSDGGGPVLFIDTDMYVMKVWGEFVFGRCDIQILEEIVRRRYDGYLLCQTDLPWTADELREYPDEGPREILYHMYRDCMINQSTPWFEVSGQAGERLERAIGAVRAMLAR